MRESLLAEDITNDIKAFGVLTLSLVYQIPKRPCKKRKKRPIRKKKKKAFSRFATLPETYEGTASTLTHQGLYMWSACCYYVPRVSHRKGEGAGLEQAKNLGPHEVKFICSPTFAPNVTTAS